jgi:hypothetical protein
MLPTTIQDQLIHAYIHSETLSLDTLRFMFDVYQLPWLKPKTLEIIKKAKEVKWGFQWR